MTDTALDRLRTRCADQPPRIAVVLGSGWGGLTARLQDAERILAGVSGVSFNYFTAKDVVRHPLVARIIEAYDRDDGAAG